jgi:hypothetical protein
MDHAAGALPAYLLRTSKLLKAAVILLLMPLRSDHLEAAATTCSLAARVWPLPAEQPTVFDEQVSKKVQPADARCHKARLRFSSMTYQLERRNGTVPMTVQQMVEHLRSSASLELFASTLSSGTMAKPCRQPAYQPHWHFLKANG